jgi:hypothetical protein
VLDIKAAQIEVDPGRRDTAVAPYVVVWEAVDVEEVDARRRDSEAPDLVTDLGREVSEARELWYCLG